MAKVVFAKWMSIKSWLWPIRPHVCVYCGRRLRYKQATVDHFRPQVVGGEHSDENCVISCGPCNNRKGEMEFATLEEARSYLGHAR